MKRLLLLAVAASMLAGCAAIRDARQNWTAENHLFNTLHRGYTAIPPDGIAECPFDFYKLWVTDPQKCKQMVESLTRATAIPVAATTH